jgi:cytochrome c556
MIDSVILFAEKFGLIAVACGAAFWMVNKQQMWIQNEAMKEMRESFGRLEGIVIGLINSLKKHAMDLKGLKASYTSLVEIIRKLSGNGLKDKFK